MASADRKRKIRMIGPATAILIALLVVTLGSLPVAASDCAKSSVGFTPLSDLGASQYQGYPGGLYPGGSNVRPAGHEATGHQLAEQVVPRGSTGTPGTTSSKIVFLSIGMSNTRLEFQAFMEQALNDPNRHPSVVVVNGAEGGKPAEEIRNPADDYWTFLDNKLAQAGATGEQVQAVWLKEANGRPTEAFPRDASNLREDLKAITAILKDRFPNLWLVYVSSRIYAGYATSGLNPEPFAYQSGFAVKWLIEDQINGKLPVAAGAYPWLSWGPYLWADGLRARSDGLTWSCNEFQEDGTHPNDGGADKVANLIFDFVHSDPTARAWYENGGGLGSVPPSDRGFCGLLRRLDWLARLLPLLCAL